MTRMNFNTQLKDDDKLLIDLLKEQTLETAPSRLAEDVLTRIASIEAQKKFKYKPIRTPLYIMILIAMLLFLPFFIPMASNDPFLGAISQILRYPIGSMVHYAVWMWLAVVAVCISLITFRVQHTKSFKHEN